MSQIHLQITLLFSALLFCLLGIVWSSLKWKLHPFLSLTFASLLFGISVNGIDLFLGAQQGDIKNIVQVYSQGFGSLLSNIGLVIIFGVLLGKVLEKSGAAEVMAHKVLSFMGVQRAPWAMSFLGWIISVPVFCDSGYILLSSFKKSLSKVSGVPLAILSMALATGLYASHTLVPPTPGPLVAAANVGLQPKDLLWVILVGGMVSIFSVIAGGLCAQRCVPKLLKINTIEKNLSKNKKISLDSSDSFLKVTAPMLLPLVLIAISSIFSLPLGNSIVSQPVMSPQFLNGIHFLGNPLVALLLGFVFAYFIFVKSLPNPSSWVVEALQEASLILLITGAGGGFGAMIKASPISEIIKQHFSQGHLSPLAGLWLLFFIAALLKTAQGSSTASLVITSSMAVTLLTPFGLQPDTDMVIPMGPILAVMSMGAGAMVVSHVNDSYFWVVTQFSNMSMAEGYKSLSLSTLIQGLAAMMAVSFLALLFL